MSATVSGSASIAGSMSAGDPGAVSRASSNADDDRPSVIAGRVAASISASAARTAARTSLLISSTSVDVSPTGSIGNPSFSSATWASTFSRSNSKVNGRGSSASSTTASSIDGLLDHGRLDDVVGRRGHRSGHGARQPHGGSRQHPRRFEDAQRFVDFELLGRLTHRQRQADRCRHQLLVLGHQLAVLGGRLEVDLRRCRGGEGGRQRRLLDDRGVDHRHLARRRCALDQRRARRHFDTPLGWWR